MFQHFVRTAAPDTRSSFIPTTLEPRSSKPTVASLSQRELDVARLELLRRRVTTFATVVGAIIILLAIVQWWIATFLLKQQVAGPSYLGLFTGFWVGIALMVMPRIRRKSLQQATLKNLVRRTNWIVIITVLSQTPSAELLARGFTQVLRPLGFEGNLGPIFVLVIFMVLVHSTAALIVPWTVKEALVAPLAWMAVTLLASLFGTDSANFRYLGLGLTFAAGVPGVLITFFRSSGLRELLGLRRIGERYAEAEREMAFARRLHERLFPQPIRDGAIRLEYAYEPMRQIGGDHLDATRAADGSLLVVITDVTGHGVAAALAVNRLHGELKRLLAENPAASPASLITSLNRYVHLTFSDESVFATAVAVRLATDGRATLCIGGHPPPLLRAANGAVTTIDSTAPMLGPFAPDEFTASEINVHVPAGASLILYTDGAIEGKNAAGHELGIPALQRAVETGPSAAALAPALLAAVAAHRAGPADDDVLIAVLTMSPD